MPPVARIDSHDADLLAEYFAARIVAAGALAMEVLARPTIESQIKSDKSPVSEADERVEEFLLRDLSRDLPDIPYIAEETAAKGEIASHDGAFFLIDPIDGTKEFLSRSNDFTVNLALIRDGAPFAGAVYAPAQGRVWFAGAKAYEVMATPGEALPPRSAWRELRVRPRPADGMIALVSKSHLDSQTKDFLAGQKIAGHLPMGSSIKFCLVASADGDVYPRFGPTMEWDTAAGDAVLRAAGGMTLSAEGGPLRYGKADQGYKNGAFIAWGGAPA